MLFCCIVSAIVVNKDEYNFDASIISPERLNRESPNLVRR